MERSGTNALGVRRPVSAAAPRCKAPAGRGCRRGRLGERNCRAISLPPSALRAATSLAEGGKGKRIPTPVRALARNDRGTGWTGSSAPTMRDGAPTSRQRGSAALQGPHWEGAVGAGDWGRGIAVRYRSLRQSYALPPPSQREARGNGFLRQCAHWLGMTGVRGGQGRPPLRCGTSRTPSPTE